MAKSDHSDGDSPGRVDSNGATKDIEEEEKVGKEEEPTVPPYLPAIQGKVEMHTAHSFRAIVRK